MAAVAATPYTPLPAVLHAALRGGGARAVARLPEGGYPAPDAKVPGLEKKTLDEIASFV